MDNCKLKIEDFWMSLRSHLSYGERGESARLWKQSDMSVEKVK
jgi:hypothetical protein